MASPYPLPPGCIFREDFTNPKLAADNGLVITGNPWMASGVRMAAPVTMYLPRLNISLMKTAIIDADFGGGTFGYFEILRRSDGFIWGVEAFGDRRQYIVSGAPAFGATVPSGRRLMGFTLDGTSYKFFIDGSVTTSGSVTAARNWLSTYMSIGSANPAANSNHFQNPLFGIRLYNYALSADEIAQDYRTIRGLQA